MDRDGGGKVAKVAGAGLIGVLAIFGKVADDCGKAGLRASRSADDIARLGAKEADDFARLAPAGRKGAPHGAGPLGAPGYDALPPGGRLGVAEDLARHTGAGAEGLEQGARRAELTDEALKTAAEEGSLNMLDAWLSDDGESDEEDGEATDAASAPKPPWHTTPVLRVMWTFAPLAVDDLEAYLGRAPAAADLAGHGRLRNSDGALLMKPIFSGLPVSRSFGLREQLKAFVGYTLEGHDEQLRLWEGGAIAIDSLQSACLLRKQTCIVVACTRLDFAAASPCAATARSFLAASGRQKGPRAAIRVAIRARNEAKRDDIVIHAAAVVDGRPRFMHSRYGE
jgi:hypothetical protein